MSACVVHNGKYWLSETVQKLRGLEIVIRLLPSVGTTMLQRKSWISSQIFLAQFGIVQLWAVCLKRVACAVSCQKERTGKSRTADPAGSATCAVYWTTFHLWQGIGWGQARKQQGAQRGKNQFLRQRSPTLCLFRRPVQRLLPENNTNTASGWHWIPLPPNTRSLF